MKIFLRPVIPNFEQKKKREHKAPLKIPKGVKDF